MYDNYTDVQNQLRAAGLCGDRVTVLEVKGRVVRTPVEGDRERRGWYLLHALPAPNGGEVLVGSFGIWHGDDNGAQKIALDDTHRLTDEQRAAMREKWREDRRRAEAVRKAEAERAARRAEKVWRKCAEALPETGVGYLSRKCVGAHGVRFSPQGAIVLAIHDGQGRVHGLQFILDPVRHAKRIARTGRDKEYWPQGLQKQGHYFLIGAVSDLCLVCEGYATGASLHEATGLPVVVAFDAGNLAPVVRALRKTYPRARFLICADDDFATAGNPGITAAGNAALAIDGAWLAPAFHVDDQVQLRARVLEEIDFDSEDRGRAAVKALLQGTRKLTDFNDLHVAEGLLTVRAQVEMRLRDLGWKRVESAAPDTQPGEAGRAVDDWRFDIEVLLREYSLIYATDTCFDHRRRMIVGLGPLRAAATKTLVREWLEHPERDMVLPEQVGFDPGQRDPAIKCNLWGGWPTVPQRGSCERLLELLEYLCSGEQGGGQELHTWILKWLAFPIQHPGAKMQTALLMHGPEGTGKNTFFGVVRQIYGRYACQFSQVELESNFNGWASGKLFAIGNEVVSRAEMYHIQGRLKAMITEPEWVINEKMLPARSEQNHCNFAFFSNRIDIAKLDDGDRRYCVVWTPPALPAEIYQEVAEEIRAGGVAALHDYLLHLDLSGFNEHTKPPHSQAKQDLVELGMDSTERFFRDWSTGDLDAELNRPCPSGDLYEIYRLWTRREGIPKPAQKQTLLTAVGKKPGVRKADERWQYSSGTVKRGMVIFPPGCEPPPGRSRQEWLGEQIGRFKDAMNEFRKANLQEVA